MNERILVHLLFINYKGEKSQQAEKVSDTNKKEKGKNC